MTFKLNADVSDYQPNTVAYMQKLKGYGVSSITTKITEGTNYKNPSRIAQMNSANSAGMVSHYYHFAQFTTNENIAVKEGDYFVDTMKKDGCSTGAVAFLDFEPVGLNPKIDCTQAITTFFRVLVNRGYKRVGLYTGKYIMNNLNWNKIKTAVLKMGAKCCYLWVANYGVTSPQVDNVDIWQYSNTFHGLSQDISYDFKGILVKEDNASAPKPKPKPDTSKPNQSGSAFKIGQHVKVNKNAKKFIDETLIPDFVRKSKLQVCEAPIGLDKGNGYKYHVWLDGVKLGWLKGVDLDNAE